MAHETQETVGAWIDETFPGTDPDSPRKSLRALEECVELCLASGATYSQVINVVRIAVHKKIPQNVLADLEISRPEPDTIPSEAADVLIVLYGVAHMRGFDLHAEVDRKMSINRARRWAPRGDGTGYHVPQPDAEV